MQLASGTRTAEMLRDSSCSDPVSALRAWDASRLSSAPLFATHLPLSRCSDGRGAGARRSADRSRSSPKPQCSPDPKRPSGFVLAARVPIGGAGLGRRPPVCRTRAPTALGVLFCSWFGEIDWLSQLFPPRCSPRSSDRRYPGAAERTRPARLWPRHARSS
jgi:hypothetical protein